MKKVLLIVNPSSGGEKAKSFERKFKKKLEEFFDFVEVKHTEKSGDAEKFASHAAEEEFTAVFAMGGDGTVNEVISGLAEKDFRPKFGFLPLGTVNDLARALKIPLDVNEAISNFNFRKTRPLDIGKINDKYFMNVVAIGVLPEAINDVAPELKTKIGKLAYFISGFRKIMENRPRKYRITFNGEKRKIKTSTILIGLTNSIGGFEQILPRAKVDDGKLHLIWTKDKNIFGMMRALPNLIFGVTKTTENLEYHRIKNVKIELKKHKQFFTNVDGDKGDALPVEIKILPSHIEVYGGK